MPPPQPLFKAYIYSHFVKLVHPTSDVRNLLFRYCSNYVEYGYRKEGASSQNQPVHVYASRLKDHSEYRLHINQYAEFKQVLRNAQIGPHLYEEIVVPLAAPELLESPLQPQWIAKDYQVGVIDYLASPEGPNSRVLTLQTGKGKAQPLDSLIKVPDGWVRMGDIQVGDAVIAQDGTTASITGIYPQGLQPCYRITFEDDRSVEATLDHLWEIVDVSDIDPVPALVPRYYRPRVVDTGTLLSMLGRNECPLIRPIEPAIKPDVALPIPPALLGRLLAGHRSSKLMEWCFRVVYRLALDYESLQNIPDGLLGLYLESSEDQRMALLSRFFEHAQKDYRSTMFVVTHESCRVLKFVQEMVWSVGGSANHIPISVTDDQMIHTLEVAYRPALKVVDVRYFADRECQCISIDHPSQLYVTDDYIPTHNTFSALASISQINYRTVLVILPIYIDKWIEDIQGTLTVTRDDVMLVQGSSHLKGLIDLARSGGLKSKIIIISAVTLSNFYKLYESDPYGEELKSYDILPDELFPVLKAGVILIDETHQHIRTIFKMMLYSHVDRIIALTATLISENPVISRVHRIMYPTETRYNNLEYDRYAHVYGIAYNFRQYQPQVIRTTEYGSSTYSHTAFEKSLFRKPHLLYRYIDMIVYIANLGYIRHYQPGDKLLIYASTVKMCDILVETLQTTYPDRKVRRYVEKDNYENLETGDIIVSTIISAGTAVDIGHLTTVILTINIASPVSNLQALGRLRKIEGRDVRFYYLYCEQIPKHREYARRKQELLKDKAQHLNDLVYPDLV